MIKSTFQKAKALDKKIDEFTEALNCFEWTDGNKTFSTNPRLIIEFDNDGREQLALPMNLSNELVAFLKTEIKKGLDDAKSEFEAL